MDETMYDVEVKPNLPTFDNMMDGSIVTIELHNFMTFTKVIYNAHPKLNLIIGPNGSGKSSIVTALILGFGGNPKDINRGDKVSQFVKQGKNEADIFIELYRKSNRNMKLRRTIFVINDTCHYYINNVKVSKIKYIECVESFNIKVHNLCQFLPQDRLEDFSKLDSKGLLFNALQSIENQELLDNFKVLKELANSMTSYDGELKNLKNSIDKETDTNMKLETIVTSFTEKQTIEKELLTILQKRHWILYITAWDKIKNEIKKFDDSNKYNDCALKIIDQQLQIINEKKKGDVNLKNFVLQNIDISTKLMENISKEILVSEHNVNSIMELHDIAKNVLIKIEDQEMYILNIQKKIEIMNNEVICVEDYKEKIIIINQNINDIDVKILSKKSNLEKVKNKLTSITGIMYAINQEIEHEQRNEDGKNQLIHRNYPEMWKAINWLRKCEKQSIFHGQVFEPLFTQIEVHDKKNAKYIENIVNYRDLIAFVFEFAEDLTTFNKIVKKEGWKKINSISAPPPNIQINETPNYDIQSLKQFGFHSYAMDMIKAPSVIRRYLAQNCNLHNIPIGSEEVMNNIERLPNNIKFFFAGNDQVIIRMSTYTGEKITRQTQIANEAQFLIFSVDSNLIQSLMAKKNNTGVEYEDYEKKCTEFTNELKNFEDSRQPFFAEKKTLQNKYAMFQNREKIFLRLENELKIKQHELQTEKKKSTNFTTQNLEKMNNYIKSMELIIEMLNNYANITKTLEASVFIACNFLVNVTEDNNMLKQLKTLYINNLENYYLYFDYVKNLENTLKNIKKEALYWTRGVSPYDKEIFEPLKEKFESIGKNDVVELDVLISEKIVQLNCLNVDPNALQLLNEYKTRKLNIKELETRLINLNVDRQSKENNIDNLHSQWFPKLQELTVLLNTNFKKFLTMFGCKGLIELDIGDTRYNFEAYGLLIKVQFRNNMDDMNVSTMRLLDAKSQSGGERALTTALFLLTLQEVTHFPFRIVDEINQGMDKIYEKKLMELFMELFENRNNQYLVVTPKLIKNLSFKNTSVDIIFS